MVMTVEPGFGGQAFMKDVAAASSCAARDSSRHKPHGGEVHVDGGVNRETAEFAGALGVDVLVVGSALLSRATTWPARSGSSAPSPTRATSTASTTACRRSRATGWSRSRRCRSTWRRRFMDEIEAGGIPVLMLRGDGQMNPDGVRDYDLLRAGVGRGAGHRAPRRGRGPNTARGRRPWREDFIREHGRGPRRPASREGPPPAGDRARGPRRRRGRRRDRAGARRPRSASARTTTGRSPTRSRARSPSCGSSGTTRAGRTGRSSTSVARRSSCRQFTLYADTRRGRRPGFTGAAPPELAERALPALRRGAAGSRGHGRDRAGSGPRWRSSSSTTGRSRSGSIPTIAERDAP